MANIFTYCFYGRDPKKIYFVIPSSLFYIIFAIAIVKYILSTHLKTCLEVIAESILSAHLFFLFSVAIAKFILPSNLFCYLQRRYENLFCQHIFFFYLQKRPDRFLSIWIELLCCILSTIF